MTEIPEYKQPPVIDPVTVTDQELKTAQWANLVEPRTDTQGIQNVQEALYQGDPTAMQTLEQYITNGDFTMEDFIRAQHLMLGGDF